ncbi:A/G-specific adenine glycosylase [Metabacillus arenae]|uniref:Adenine DNA glycosylase n=1 Tax=Metabacillus arenae TaxID=2771434 RepID=A0A926NGL6_9BACI|nr:A/G-specific adenine glycosylase [Metabacillus arenae]MBD1379658.1 A/G-specific adenine glycosylase [Metabacillus arenae]
MVDYVKEKLKTFNIYEFQQDLLDWYDKEKRDLPWRQDQDPYKVWVSEIMLQQTRVDTVIPYFHHFIEKFPTIKALAEAEEEEVLKAWEGLGYYSRVRNLQAAVREVHESYSGIVPDTPDTLGSLKGVGPYTKGAILSIAYNIPEPAVDGNVMRVVSRLFSIWDDIAKPKSRKIFEEIIYKIISKENPSDFNQSLMELGAIICTPASPACLICPVQEHCSAFEEGVERELPVKSKKKKPLPKQISAVVLTDDEDNYYIHKRPASGLLANLWEFPNFEMLGDFRSYRELLTEAMKEEYGVTMELSDIKGTIPHVFSHLIWNISVYFAKVEDSSNTKGLIKVNKTEIQRYAFPVSHQKIMQLYKDNQACHQGCQAPKQE